MDNMIEQKDDPNIEEKYGIDFSALKPGEFKAGSGAVLQFEKGYGYISISDGGKYELSAEVESGILKVRLFTKDRETGLHHPDMFASKFLETALSYFEKQGVIIREFRDIWEKGSDTYERFQAEYSLTGSLIEAAKSNLLEPVRRRGFTDIKDQDVRIVKYPDNPEFDCVYATFRKKESVNFSQAA